MRTLSFRRWFAACISACLLAAGLAPAQAASIAVPSFEVSPRVIYSTSLAGPRVKWLDNDRFIVAWLRDQSGSSETSYSFELMLRLFASDGTPLSDEYHLAHLNDFFSDDSVDVAVIDSGHFAVTWTDCQYEVGTACDLYGQVFDLAGNATTLRFPVHTRFDSNQIYSQILPAANGRFPVVYRSSDSASDGNDIWVQRIDLAGTRVGAAQRLNSTTAGLQSRPAAACAASQCLATWGSSPDGNVGYVIKGQYFDNATLVPSGSEFTVYSDPSGINSHFARMAMSAAGEATVAWRSNPVDNTAAYLRFQRYKKNGTLLGGVVTLTDIANSLALPGYAGSGAFGVAWSDYVENARSKVYFRDYSPQGRALTTLTLANVKSRDLNVSPTSVAVNSAGRAVVIWAEYPTPEDQFDVHLRGAIVSNVGAAAASTAEEPGFVPQASGARRPAAVGHNLQP